MLISRPWYQKGFVDSHARLKARRSISDLSPALNSTRDRRTFDFKVRRSFFYLGVALPCVACLRHGLEHCCSPAMAVVSLLSFLPPALVLCPHHISSHGVQAQSSLSLQSETCSCAFMQIIVDSRVNVSRLSHHSSVDLDVGSSQL